MFFFTFTFPSFDDDDDFDPFAFPFPPIWIPPPIENPPFPFSFASFSPFPAFT